MENKEISYIEMEKSIREIEKEIENFILKLQSKLENDNRVINLLKGWKIFYSPKFQNPRILFIGINPGAGELNDPFKLDIENHEKLHYLEEDRNSFQLAWNTIDIFESINQSNILETDSVKINSRFYATIGEDEMYQFENILKTDYPELWIELEDKNKIWVQGIIKIISPKIIICEGKSSFDYLDAVIYKDDLGWEYEMKYEQDKICGYFRRKYDNLILFGYSRKRGLNQNSIIAHHLNKLLLEI